MTKGIPVLTKLTDKVASLRSEVEDLLTLIMQNPEPRELQPKGLRIFSELIELQKDLELLQNGDGGLAAALRPRHPDPASKSELIAGEVNKVNRRLLLWASRQQQINSRILTTYLKLRRSGHATITEDQLAQAYGNQNEFHKNYPQMKAISPNNHGKVFEAHNGIVKIWEPVRDAVARYEAMVFGEEARNSHQGDHDD